MLDQAMVQYLINLNLLEEVTAVLDGGHTLCQAYFAHTDVRIVRDQYKLKPLDIGWYQICYALGVRNKSSDTLSVNFTPFEAAFQALTETLYPQVSSFGFLRCTTNPSPEK
jgi:hypothetical protein